MGYFNYFIKCIIRNIAYKLCKPKVLLTVLLSAVILFVLHSTGYCTEWSQTEIEQCLDGLATITSNQGVMISQLSSMGVNVSDIETKLDTINITLNNIKVDTNLTVEKLHNLLSEVESLNTTLTQLAQQQNIYYQSVTSELEEIKNILVGVEIETTGVTITSYITGNINPNISYSNNVYQYVSGSADSGFSSFNYNFEVGYTYEIICTSVSASYYSDLFATMDTVSIGGPSFNMIHVYSGQMGNCGFTYKPANNGTLTIVSTNPVSLKNAIWSITKKPNSSLSGIDSSINQQGQNINNSINQGNQLQQEQNDFLKQETSDSDVSVDSFNSVDSNDITSEGLTGVFTNIYNSITSWSSKDINLPIPYTNKSIVIPANYTYNMLSSFGGSWIISFISSIYYFIVARFIIYSITSIINSIKSGSILETDSKNNITTDML